MKDLKHFVVDEQGTIVAAFKQGTDSNRFIQDNGGRGYREVGKEELGLSTDLNQAIASWTPPASLKQTQSQGSRQPA
jgi:hypothetical protein